MITGRLSHLDDHHITPISTAEFYRAFPNETPVMIVEMTLNARCQTNGLHTVNSNAPPPNFSYPFRFTFPSIIRTGRGLHLEPRAPLYVFDVALIPEGKVAVGFDHFNTDECILARKRPFLISEFISSQKALLEFMDNNHFFAIAVQFGVNDPVLRRKWADRYLKDSPFGQRNFSSLTFEMLDESLHLHGSNIVAMTSLYEDRVTSKMVMRAIHAQDGCKLSEVPSKYLETDVIKKFIIIQRQHSPLMIDAINNTAMCERILQGLVDPLVLMSIVGVYCKLEDITNPYAHAVLIKHNVIPALSTANPLLYPVLATYSPQHVVITKENRLQRLQNNDSTVHAEIAGILRHEPSFIHDIPTHLQTVDMWWVAVQADPRLRHKRPKSFAPTKDMIKAIRYES
jgi:hypothetical protein